MVLIRRYSMTVSPRSIGEGTIIALTPGVSWSASGHCWPLLSDTKYYSYCTPSTRGGLPIAWSRTGWTTILRLKLRAKHRSVGVAVYTPSPYLVQYIDGIGAASGIQVCVNGQCKTPKSTTQTPWPDSENYIYGFMDWRITPGSLIDITVNVLVHDDCQGEYPDLVSPPHSIMVSAVAVAGAEPLAPGLYAPPVRFCPDTTSLTIARINWPFTTRLRLDGIARMVYGSGAVTLSQTELGILLRNAVQSGNRVYKTIRIRADFAIDNAVLPVVTNTVVDKVTCGGLHVSRLGLEGFTDVVSTITRVTQLQMIRPLVTLESYEQEEPACPNTRTNINFTLVNPTPCQASGVRLEFANAETREFDIPPKTRVTVKTEMVAKEDWWPDMTSARIQLPLTIKWRTTMLEREALGVSESKVTENIDVELAQPATPRLVAVNTPGKGVPGFPVGVSIVFENAGMCPGTFRSTMVDGEGRLWFDQTARLMPGHRATLSTTVTMPPYDARLLSAVSVLWRGDWREIITGEHMVAMTNVLNIDTRSGILEVRWDGNTELQMAILVAGKGIEAPAGLSMRRASLPLLGLAYVYAGTLAPGEAIEIRFEELTYMRARFSEKIAYVRDKSLVARETDTATYSSPQVAPATPLLNIMADRVIARVRGG